MFGGGGSKHFGLSNRKEFVKIKSSTCNKHFLFLPVSTILTLTTHDMFVQLQYPIPFLVRLKVLKTAGVRLQVF